MTTEGAARRVHSVERKIIDAASQLLGARPIEDVTLDDVAAASGLDVGDVKRHFQGVGRIASRILQELIGLVDEGADWLDAPLDADLRSLLELQARNVASIYARHGAVIAAISEASPRSPDVRAAWAELIDARVRRVAERLRVLELHGIVRVLDPDLVAGALVLMVHHTLVRIYRHRAEVPVDQAARAIFSVWVHTVFPDVAPAA